MATSPITIVIAGAGYGGLSAARVFGRSGTPTRVIVIDQNPYHLLQYQLHEAAVGKIEAKALAIPLRSLLPRRVEFKQAGIRRFDFEKQVVQTDRGDVAYDRLIIALGGQPATFNIPGLHEHALTLKSLKDANRINGHIEWVLANAAKMADAQARSAALTFAIGGAGITGVETAAEMAERLGDRAREYGIEPGEVRILLLEAASTVLPGFDSETIAEATDTLKQAGVAVRTNAAVARLEAGRAILKNGQVIRADTFIWAGGVRANQLVLESGLKIEGRGAAAVDYFLRSVDQPNVAIVGDNALVRDPRHGGTAIPCAQLAVKEGAYAAHDLIAELKGDVRHRYVPRLQGLLISLGGRRGVGTIGPVWVRRLIARLGKIGAETRYLWNIGGARLLIARWLWLRAEWVGLARRARLGRQKLGRLATGAR